MNITGVLSRNLPHFKGKQRVVKNLLGNKLQQTKDIWIKGKYGCWYLLPNLIENVSFELFMDGIYEPYTSDLLLEKIPPGGIFLDLGANIGAVSIPLFKRRRDINIVCVEASPRIFGYLDKNLDRNGFSAIKRINNAVFYSDGIEMDFFSPDDKHGKGSLSPVFTDKANKVTTLKVDTLVGKCGLPGVNVIKIDVEGYEYHVFKGAEGLLTDEKAPDILFEFVDWAEEQADGVGIGDAQRLLRSYGYRIFHLDDHTSGQLRETEGVVQKGFAMLYATKRTKG
jgi:FkbM family methyltransferase